MRCVASQRTCEWPAPRSEAEKKRSSSQTKTVPEKDQGVNGDAAGGVGATASGSMDGVPKGPWSHMDPSSYGQVNGSGTSMSFGMGVAGPSGFDLNGAGLAPKAASTTILGKSELVSPPQISPSEIFNITPAAMANSVSPAQQQVSGECFSCRPLTPSSPRQI